MHLAILGATGRAGRVLTEQALAHGDKVTALVRDPAKIKAVEGLEIVVGDVRDPQPVRTAIAGADAVVSVLGRHRRGPEVCTEGIRTLLPAMATAGVRRLAVLSNYGVADSRHRSAYVAVSWMLEGAVLRDKEHMEELIRASNTHWTVVRAPILTNGPHTGRYRTGADLRLTFTSKVSRADLAEFVRTELIQNNHVREAVAITCWRGPSLRSRR